MYLSSYCCNSAKVASQAIASLPNLAMLLFALESSYIANSALCEAVSSWGVICKVTEIVRNPSLLWRESQIQQLLTLSKVLKAILTDS